MKKTNILNVPIDVISKSEALNKLLFFLEEKTLGEEKHRMLFTPNPEQVMLAQKDKEFMHIINQGDLVVADGVGILLASKLNKVKIKERVPGCDLIFSLFDKVKDKPYTIYLFGGAPGVAEKAKVNLEKKFSGIKIVGTSDGYFDKRKERIIIKEIQRLKPDILIVGLGCPKQERWIYNNNKRLPVKISAGVGGSIDIMAGSVKRAPLFFRKIGMEWFYRLITQPTRIFRMVQLPLFMIEVIKKKLLRCESEERRNK